MTSTDTYQLKWHSHSSHLNGSVASLLRSERFTDVVLCTMDGSQIPAHKFILSSCSVYLSNLFEGQRSVTRMGGMLYVVLPSEISTKALKILVEYMYKGETTVSNEVLDTVLKAGEVLKIRGLWKQTEDGQNESAVADKPATVLNKAAGQKKDGEMLFNAKIALKKDDNSKVLKTFSPMQQTGGTSAKESSPKYQPINRPMLIGPPKLVFIKTSEGGTQATLRPGGPKGQTILVTQAPQTDSLKTVSAAKPIVSTRHSPEPSNRVLRRSTAEKKYGKKPRMDSSDKDESSDSSRKTSNTQTEIDIQIKEEPNYDEDSMDGEDKSIAEMFQADMTVKQEPIDDVDIDEDSLIYNPLTCELCAEVFTVPAAWVRHVEAHALEQTPRARVRKERSASDDTEETMALLRCDLCQKHFPNPAEWVRHIQGTHTETEGVQNKTCMHCKKVFPSHASMLVHFRTHTGERPFVCGLCNKGFNVKSNLLRHLRTLHDQQLGPLADSDAESEPAEGPSQVKAET